MQFEKLRLSIPIMNHPMIKEKSAFKIKYVNIIEYFARKYSKDEFSKAIIRFYQELFGIGEVYSYDEKAIIKYVKTATATKIKGFKFFTYRYILIADCLLVSGYYNEKNIAKMVDEIKQIFNKRYHKKINSMIDAFVGKSEVKIDMVDKYITYWNINKNFESQNEIKILVTANMSAGKSTLLNALIGKKVNRTKNEACTAKVHYILNKPLEDGLSYEWDGGYNLNANNEDLMNDAKDNMSKEIGVGTYFFSDVLSKRRIVFIDTPGVNSSLDEEHAIITRNVIDAGDYDCILYVLNAENIGTEDDVKHLKYVFESCKDKRIIFVVNKLDRYRSVDDSIAAAIDNVLQDLKKIGFEAPLVYPISAYAAMLTKKELAGDVLTEEEQDEYKLLNKKFNKEEYDMRQYYEFCDESISIENKNQMLAKCGLTGLEYTLINM